MGLMLVGEENGIRRYAVTLDNSMAIIAGQLDIKLPSGMRIAGISTAERNLNHEVQSYDQSSRLTRVAIYSMENAAFEANSGAVLYIDVEGNGDFKVDNMILTDINYNTIVLESGSHSIVDSIMEGAREMGTKIYNTAGMMLNRIQKGINIFRTSDGKVKKEYNKK